uniref:Uncharacterized protein n=1 Tax=Parascaris equorum TaxID=6256 RepID=A0A914RLQ0_PAREQ
MERDAGDMIAKITELERKNVELSLQLKRQSETLSPLNDETGSQTEFMLAPQTELRIEKERIKIMENELLELKKLMLQSDNQKLVALASRVRHLL